MKFGPVAVVDADGAVLAHAINADDRRFKKGHRLCASDIAILRSAHIVEVIVARLEPGDIGEDEAAAQLAAALAGGGVRTGEAATGRTNLYAKHAGLFSADRDAVMGVNAIDPALTLATLPDGTWVEEGRMVATVKIIPFAVPAEALERACATAGGLALHRCVRRRVALVSTMLPTLKRATVAKTKRVLEGRLAPLGASLVSATECEHEETALTSALVATEGADLVIVFGASAICDRRDVIPATIEKLPNGRVERFGMPADPGNLLLTGWMGETPIIGAPGCARSPVENGFDWVLQRLLCNAPMSDEWWRACGVGGLLLESSERPHSRETT